MSTGEINRHKLYAKLTILAALLIIIVTSFTIYKQSELINLFIIPYFVVTIPLSILDNLPIKSTMYSHRIKVILIFSPVLSALLFFILLTILRYTVFHKLDDFPYIEIFASSFAFLLYYILNFVYEYVCKILAKIYKFILG